MSLLCDTTVIIPQRNHGSMTLTCLESLRRWHGDGWPIIIVDDGSHEGSRALIQRAQIPNCRVIAQLPRGVTAAWNLGLRAVTSPFMVLLNNDVIVDGAFLDALLEPLRNRHALITGVEWRIEPLVPQCLAPHLPARRLLAGWCLAMEMELWSRLGGFDESLRLYYSDTDFQLRAVEVTTSDRTTLGVVPSLPLHHLGHQTTRDDPQRSAVWQADRARFLKKWERWK